MKLRSIFIICGLVHGLYLFEANAAAPSTTALSAGDELSLSVFDDVAVTRKAIVSESDIQALSTAQPAVNDELIYHFFDNALYTVKLSRVSEVFNGAKLLEGGCTGSAEITFQSIISGNNIRCELNDTKSGFMYQAVSRFDGSLQITEYDRGRGEEIFHNDVVTLPGEQPGDTTISLSTAPIEVSPLSTSEIDIMLVFDQTAQSWANANGGVTNLANAIVSKMNTAHVSSGTESTFRLIHIYLSSHSYNSPTEDLGSILSDIYYKQGGVSDVSGLRDSVGADLACMLVDTGSAYGSTGIAYLPGSSSGSSSAAFSVCSIRSVNISHTMTHEIGHNLGCGHTKTQATQPGPGIFSYAAGWYFTGLNNTKYHTIMGYNSDGGNYYYPCGLFSSPLLTFQSVTAGSAADGDNALCIRNMKSVIAGYRTSTFNTVSDPVITPATGTSFHESLTVTVSCATESAAIRYTTDGSEPSESSTLYSSSITITNSTTFKAKAFKSGSDPSSTVLAAYSIIAANDLFANATEINTVSGPVAGNNIECSKESGEPNHYSSGGSSVWWKWIAPKSGEVIFNTSSSSFDTIMAAYTGSSLSALTKLDQNDDSNGGLQSEIAFSVTAGEEYYIAVDGYNGAEGNMSLNWDLEYIEVSSSAVVSEAGDKVFRIQFAGKSGETYVVKRKDSLRASDPWYDFTPPLTLTPELDPLLQVDIAIPQNGGSAFFKIIKQ